jgi:hypothetical protein
MAKDDERVKRKKCAGKRHIHKVFVIFSERGRRKTNEGAGGRGGIRTHEGLAPLAVFKTAALNHSATLPYR